MLSYTVTPNQLENPDAETTVHIEGDVTLSDWERLRVLCLDTLRHNKHIVLNIERVSKFDCYLGIFVCLLRRTAQLSDQRVTVRGKQDRGFCCISEDDLDPMTRQLCVARDSEPDIFFQSKSADEEADEEIPCQFLGSSGLKFVRLDRHRGIESPRK